jgi:hypothetical protein
MRDYATKKGLDPRDLGVLDLYQLTAFMVRASLRQRQVIDASQENRFDVGMNWRNVDRLIIGT